MVGKFMNTQFRLMTIRTVVAIFGLFVLAPSYAGTCSITANTLMFGQYGGTSASPAVNGDGTVFVSCTDSNTHTFCVNRPTTLTAKIFYYLYSNPGRTAVLTSSQCLPLSGGTASPTMVTAQCPYSNPCQLSVYGRIPAGQVESPGVYAGTLPLSLTVSGSSAVTTINMAVQAYVKNGCNISADQFSFGTYVSTSELRVAQTSIHVNCSSGLRYNVGLDAGSGSFAQRTLKSGSNVLNYNLYRPDPASPSGVCGSYTTIWQNIGGNVVEGIGTGSQQNIQLCGKIPAGQSPFAGIYTDTIRATVSY